MSVIVGPWDIEVGGLILAGIEALAVNYSVKEDNFDSLQGNAYTIDGPHKASIEATFLETDIPSLKAALPQHWIANGGTLSTGETVADSDGAIDIVPSNIGNPRDLIVVSANNPGHVIRFNGTTSQISGVETTTTIRKIKVKFNVQPVQGKALVQFFKEGAVAGIS
jgi:hypothetical protein